jgi:type II secretory pathway component GspD/PulD (secretin)
MVEPLQPTPSDKPPQAGKQRSANFGIEVNNMRRLLLTLLLIPTIAFAKPVALNFHEVTVIAFAEATYKEILGKDLIVAPDVVGLDNRVSVSIKSIETNKLPRIAEEVLLSAGVKAREVDGIVRLERTTPTIGDAFSSSQNRTVVPGRIADTKESQPSEIDYEVYRPQNRTVEYLQGVLKQAGFGTNTNGQGQQAAQDALIIAGSDDRREKLRRLIEQLDQKPSALNVRAALVEFTDNETDSLSFGGVLNLIGGRLSLTANATNNASNFSRLKTGSIDTVLGAMYGDSRFHFRTQPAMRLVDGETGRLQVGSDVPVRGATTITQSGQQIQATEYRPSGLVLNVLPRVLKDRIQAKVIQEVSSFSQTTTSTIDSPTLNKRMIEAVVDAEDGEVVILGGLDEENFTEGKSGLFSWFPLSTSTSTRKTQLLVLLEFKRL